MTNNGGNIVCGTTSEYYAWGDVSKPDGFSTISNINSNAQAYFRKPWQPYIDPTMAFVPTRTVTDIETFTLFDSFGTSSWSSLETLTYEAIEYSNI